ncbi:MAG: hypothetical protein ABEI57_08275 [Halapricum sp.]
MSDRSSGVLTPTDREFLQSEGDYYEGKNARQSRYERRRGIRKRIVNSLLDFQDIATHLDEEQRRKIFAQPEKSGAESTTEFRGSIESLLGWIYLGCREEEIDFEHLLVHAVTRAEENYRRLHGGEIVDVEVDFDVEVTNRYSSVEELGRALEAGERLLARSIYKLPMIDEVPVDPEKVDVVRIVPESNRRPEREREMFRTILQAHLGIDAEVEIVGLADTSKIDSETKEGSTAAVSPEDYENRSTDETDRD